MYICLPATLRSEKLAIDLFVNNLFFTGRIEIFLKVTHISLCFSFSNIIIQSTTPLSYHQLSHPCKNESEGCILFFNFLSCG